MSEMALRNLISHAVVDTKIRSGLLTEERDRVLSQFALTDQERRALGRFDAGSLEAFAAQLDDWMRAQPELAVRSRLRI